MNRKHKRSKVFSCLHNKTWPSQEKTEKVLHHICVWILMFRGDGLSLGNAISRIYTSSLVRRASSLNENEALAYIGLLSASQGSPSPTPNSFEYGMLIYDLIWSVFCMQMPEASLGTCIMRFSGSSLRSVTALYCRALQGGGCRGRCPRVVPGKRWKPGLTNLCFSHGIGLLLLWVIIFFGLRFDILHKLH